MELNEYQNQAIATDAFSDDWNGDKGVALGLVGEAGEVAQVFSKGIRDDMSIGGLTAEKRDQLLKEVGDVLWYLAILCDRMNWDLEEVAVANLEKLSDRAKRGKISGSGDKR